jgi:Uma2 family endonuclease
MELVLDINKRYSYAEYLAWIDDKRRELVDGFIKMMSPAPGRKHQEVSGNLFSHLHRFLKKNKGACKVYHAPFDVRLPINGEKENGQIYNVVQPDICIICDPAKLDKKGCIGAPDLIVEIESFSTAHYDLTQKFNLYEASGVREYWVVFPYDEGIEVFLLQSDGKYDAGTKYTSDISEKIPISIFDGYKIDIKDIF